jgi:hypothetical protein
MVDSKRINVIGKADMFNYIVEYDTFKGKNEYKVDLVIDKDSEEYNKFINEANKIIELKYNEVNDNSCIKAKPYQIRYEYGNEGETTGEVILKTKISHSFEYKGKTCYNNAPAIFDNNNKRLDIDSEKRIKLNDKINVNIELIPYYFKKQNTVGVSLRLHAVKIIERYEGNTNTNNRNANDFGFGEYEAVKNGTVAMPQTTQQIEEPIIKIPDNEIPF